MPNLPLSYEAHPYEGLQINRLSGDIKRAPEF